MTVVRCSWGEDLRMRDYHDREWGVPLHGERPFFEQIVLQGAQAGLNWATILGRREAYREAFAGFDAHQVADFTDADIDRLAGDPRIIRNRAKITSAVANARAAVELERTDGGLDAFIWSFVGGVPQRRDWQLEPDMPAITPVSTAMSLALKQHGFSFVGPTTCYAMMQSAGLVNDHHPDCFRTGEIRRVG